MSNEVWKDHPNLPQLRVSDQGTVEYKGKVKKPFIMKNGYPAISLWLNNESRPYTVHRLVIETFGGPPPFERAMTRHLDGDRTNNRLDNLARGTGKENSLDRHAHGTMLHGERSKLCRISDADAAEMRRLRQEGARLSELAQKFNCAVSTVSQITRGRSRQHQEGPVLDRYVRSKPVDPYPKTGPKNPERDAAVLAAARAGARGPELAQRYKLTRQRIGQICREAGFHLPRSHG